MVKLVGRLAGFKTYLFVVLLQQSGRQVCRSTQLILKENTADSTEQLEAHFPIGCHVLLFVLPIPAKPAALHL